MSKSRDSADFVEDILLAAKKAREFVADYDFAEFQKDDKTAFAVVRALEIVGEATKHYENVNLEVVWKSVNEDFAALIPQIELVLNELRGDEVDFQD